jgi:hypothetical protein
MVTLLAKESEKLKILIALFLALLSHLSGDAFAKTPLEQCNWLVTYKNRTYDLSPLTREGLSRPLEGDIRSVLQRVPSAEAHLQMVDKNVRDAKFYTKIATFGIAAFAASRLIRSNLKPWDSQGRQGVDVLAVVSALIFLKSTTESSRASDDTKTELNSAIDEFNQNSDQQILPEKGNL